MTAHLDPAAGEEAWVDEYRRGAREAWGARRASAIDEAVRRTALAVRRLMQIEFEPSEAPGFYFDPRAGPPGPGRPRGTPPSGISPADQVSDS